MSWPSVRANQSRPVNHLGKHDRYEGNLGFIKSKEFIEN